MCQKCYTNFTLQLKIYFSFIQKMSIIIHSCWRSGITRVYIYMRTKNIVPYRRQTRRQRLKLLIGWFILPYKAKKEAVHVIHPETAIYIPLVSSHWITIITSCLIHFDYTISKQDIIIAVWLCVYRIPVTQGVQLRYLVYVARQ